MSTNGVIAKPGRSRSWMGRYHHWDSYPEELGVTLIMAKDRFFGGDLKAMVKHLIDDEHVGWSTINVQNPAGPPSWVERTAADFAEGEDSRSVNPQSYTARGEKPWSTEGGSNWLRSSELPDGNLWCYVLEWHGIRVYYGGHGQAEWRCVATVRWNNDVMMRNVAAGDPIIETISRQFA